MFRASKAKSVTLDNDRINKVNYLIIIIVIPSNSQWAKSPKKQFEECIFDNMALCFECRINNFFW